MSLPELTTKQFRTMKLWEQRNPIEAKWTILRGNMKEVPQATIGLSFAYHHYEDEVLQRINDERTAKVVYDVGNGWHINQEGKMSPDPSRLRWFWADGIWGLLRSHQYRFVEDYHAQLLDIQMRYTATPLILEAFWGFLDAIKYQGFNYVDKKLKREKSAFLKAFKLPTDTELVVYLPKEQA